MPYRSNADLWFNVPGIVAAYQPVGAPGPLIARYNVAHGGDNRYKATDGVAPTWAGHTGWTFTGSEYLTTTLLPSVGNTLIARFSNWTATTDHHVAGAYNAATITLIALNPNDSGGINSVGYWNGRHPAGYKYQSPLLTRGVMAVSGVSCYRNGVLDITLLFNLYAPTVSIYIGALNKDGSASNYAIGNVQTVAIYNRVLSASEVWTVSRQMTYCHANPDWSAWGRRRRYYYGPEVAAAAAAVGIYGIGRELALPGGVSIQAMRDEVHL